MTDTNERKKTAVILSGGGANGAFEVGVMKALLTGQSPSTGYRPLDPDIYSGSSVGGYNASFMVSRAEVGSAQAVDELEDTWVNKIGGYPEQCGNGVYRFRGDPIDFFHPACIINHPLQPFIKLVSDSVFLTGYGVAEAAKFVQSQEPLVERILDTFNLTAFVSIQPFEQLIRETINFARIRESDKILRVVATNWVKGTPGIFKNENMTDEVGLQIIRGSAAIPGFFPPALINGIPHVDGCVLMTTPLSPAVGAGTDTLHVVFLDPKVENIPVERLQSTLGIFSRFYVIFTAAQFRNDLLKAGAINRGLEIMRQVASGTTMSEEELKSFIQVAEQMERRMKESRPYKKLTIVPNFMDKCFFYRQTFPKYGANSGLCYLNSSS